MLSRRQLLAGSSAAALVALNPHLAHAWTHGSLSGFNGGKTQVNTTNAQQPGSYYFINMMKGAGTWNWSSLPTSPSAPSEPVVELDSDGYPTSFPTQSGTTGVFLTLPMPSSTQESGLWVMTWDGSGTVAVDGSGNLSGVNRYEWTRSGSSTAAQFNIYSTSASPNHVRNIKIFRKVDETLVNAGKLVYPPHLTLMRQAKPGVIRSLGFNGGFGNLWQLATWAQRKPRTYYTYETGYWLPAWWAGDTTNSGYDYTVSLSGYSKTDKSVVQLRFNASGPSVIGSTGVTYSGSTGTNIIINWPLHGCAANNSVMFRGGGAGLSDYVTYYAIVVDANNIKVTATRSGSAINSSNGASGTFTTALAIPTINVNSTGATPLTSGCIAGAETNLKLGAGEEPRAAGMTTLVYDAATGWFFFNRDMFTCGVPPEVFIDYCAEVGAHPHICVPHFALEPVTDLTSTWVGYAKNTYGWMKPRVECSNEVWNFGFVATYYAQSVSYALWGVRDDVHNAYGKWVSVVGQAASSIYSNDRTKYSMLCGVQTDPFHGASDGGQNDRLASTKYVSVNGGQPAYKYADRVMPASYFGQAYSCQTLIDGFNYTVTYNGNSTQQSSTANSFINRFSGSNVFFTIDYVAAIWANCKTWAQSFNASSGTVTGLTCYEGGYSPDADYLPIGSAINGSNCWNTNILTATQANPCVLGLQTSTYQYFFGPMTGNPAVVGMGITISGAAGMTGLNNDAPFAVSFTGGGSANISGANSLTVGKALCFLATDTTNPVPTEVISGKVYYVVSAGNPFQVSATKGGAVVTFATANSSNQYAIPCHAVTAVSGNNVTIDYDAHLQSAYTGSGIGYWACSNQMCNNLYYAGKFTTALGTQNTALNTAFFALSGGGFTAEYPSNLIYFGQSAHPWSVLDPDIYAAQTSQWLSIVASNQ